MTLRVPQFVLLSLPLVGCPGTLLIGPATGGGDCPDADMDGVTTCGGDCDDADPFNFPGNEEACDAADNDCDGVADAGGVDFVAKGTLERSVLIWHLVDGGLDGPTEVTPEGLGTSYAPVAGDFNGDGLLDLVVERFRDFPDSDTIEVDLYLGDCDGYLQQVDSPPGFDIVGGVDIHTAADVDGDGAVDVVGWDYASGEVVVWSNQGEAGFELVKGEFELEWWNPFEQNRREFVAFPLVDHDGDGLVDLFECTNLAGQQTRCQYSVGRGDGGFDPVEDWLMDALLNGAAFADFDGDGDVDIVGGLDDDGDAGQAWIWRFQDGEFVLGGEAFDVNPVDEGGSNNRPGYGWMYPLDVDGDGDLDIITVTMNPFLEGPMDLHLVRNDGTGDFDAPEQFGTSLHPGVDITMWVQDEIAVPVHAFSD